MTLDFKEINKLAAAYKASDTDADRAVARDELWNATYQLLKGKQNLKCTTMSHEDLVHELAIHIPAWMDCYDSGEGATYVGYILRQAQKASMRAFRDSSGIPRRVWEARMKVISLITKGMPKEEAVRKVLWGLTPDMQKKVTIAIEQDLRMDSLDRTLTGTGSSDAPIGPLSDTIGYDDPAQEGIIDRTSRASIVTRLHTKHHKLVDQIMDHGISGLHDLDFGAPMTLLQKITLLSETLARVEDAVQRKSG